MGATARVRMGQCGIHRRGNCEDQQRQPSSLLGNQHGAAMPALDYANIDHAAELIAQSDALIIAAGAGIGVDSGLPGFRGNEGFWSAYLALRRPGPTEHHDVRRLGMDRQASQHVIHPHHGQVVRINPREASAPDVGMRAAALEGLRAIDAAIDFSAGWA